jgi:hypothetical protein
MILEAGIHTTEHLEMDTSTQNILKMCKALLKQMSNSEVVPTGMKEKFEKIEGTNDAVLNGKVILKRFKLFKRLVMNSAVPLLPKNVQEIPSGKHLWEAFDRVCPNLQNKQQQVLLTKKPEEAEGRKSTTKQ